MKKNTFFKKKNCINIIIGSMLFSLIAIGITQILAVENNYIEKIGIGIIALCYILSPIVKEMDE